MIVYRTKYQQLLSELYMPAIPNGITVIFLPGLPSSLGKNELTKTLVENGCVVFQPFYSGSFDSDGSFDPYTCIKDVNLFIKMAQQKNVVEVYYKKKIATRTKKIILMGTSFGSSIALLAANTSISKVVLLSPVLSYNQKFISGIETNFDFTSQMKGLLHLLKNGYPHTYRIKSYSNWESFLFGRNSQFDPVHTLEHLKQDTLVVHGKKDTSIPWTVTNLILKKIENKKIVSFYPNSAHSISSFSKKTINRIARFITLE